MNWTSVPNLLPIPRTGWCERDALTMWPKCTIKLIKMNSGGMWSGLPLIYLQIFYPCFSFIKTLSYICSEICKQSRHKRKWGGYEDIKTNTLNMFQVIFQWPCITSGCVNIEMMGKCKKKNNLVIFSNGSLFK